MADSKFNDEALKRGEFILPKNRALGETRTLKLAPEDYKPCTYLCGNSLGALPKRAETHVGEELQIWAERAVEGHFNHPKGRAWMSIADRAAPLLAELVGARCDEVACMGTLTSNLHLLMNSFYKPTSTRYKILCEAKAFPSDQYAFASQAALHGLDPQKTVFELAPRAGEFTLREEDIISVIEREGQSIALVIFPAVQYYTGQWFPMERISRVAKSQGCIVGWDLAHAIGNVPMQLHDWNVDFAVWCSYKYLNSGPGGIAGLFVHEDWDEVHKPKFAGWWGHDANSRFAMPPLFSPIRGAQGYQQSNPSVLCVASLLGSLEIFKEAGMMSALRARSVSLTSAFYELLSQLKWFVRPDLASAYEDEARPAFTIITPTDPEARGAQLSLLMLPSGADVMPRVFEGLKCYGVVGDERQPDVIRLTAAPLYNTWEDCERAAAALDLVFANLD